MLQHSEVEEKYQELLKADDKPIRKNANVQSHLKWAKAANDLMLAEGLLKISTNNKIKEELNYPDNTSFFDWVNCLFLLFHLPCCSSLARNERDKD